MNFKNIIRNNIILRVLFYRDIKAGDLFFLDSFERSNPFQEKSFVEIKNVKSGYVNYKFSNSTRFQNESCGIKTFLSCCIPQKED